MPTGNSENTFRKKAIEEPKLEKDTAIVEEKKIEEKPKKEKSQRKETVKPKDSKPKKNEGKKKESDGKTQRIIGILFVILAAFLAIALISYFTSFFGGNHQEYGSHIFDKDIKLDNTTGRIGAWLSQTLIKESFGIGAFFFVYVLAAIGFRLAMESKIRPWRIWKYALISLVWLPLFFAYIPAPKCAIFGGSVGFWLNSILGNYVGRVGTLLVLIFLFLVYAVVQFNITFNYFKRLKEQRAAHKAAQEALKNQNITDGNDDLENPIDDENTENIINEANNEVRNDSKENNFDKDDKNDEEDFPPITVIRRNPEMEIVDAASQNENSFRKPQDLVFEVSQPSEESQTPVEEKPSDTEAEQVWKPTIESIVVPVDTPLPTKEEEFHPTPKSDIKLVVEEKKEEKTVEDDGIEHHTLDTPYDPHYELKNFQFPSLDLLNDYGGKTAEVSGEELEENKNKIVETLANYGISIDKIKATIGPTVTLYEIVPAAGVRIAKIKNLEDDIALSLAALGIRIIAPIPGKGTIGIEVPNKKPETVSMKSVLASEKFQNNKYALPCAIGKTISNETYVFDLAKMPHILMAGATGQGKSVGLNAIVASLLYSKHPSELKFVMVDPKKVELTLYNRIERHYLAKLPDSEDAIITDVKKVVRTLNSLCIEMDQRYDLLKQAECRTIIEYNEKFKARKLLPTEGHRFLPYIVLVVDEFADLIMTAGRDVEAPIARLAQLARAIGIHLIIATQRPSVNIITGSIKANFPARIAFRVISIVDSKTILDQKGANQLIGRGDMLLSTGNDMVRLQCAFIDTPEVAAITEFIGAQRGYGEAFLLPEVPDEDSGEMMGDDEDNGERDSLFEEAARIVVQTQQGSTSMIQRKLKLGYNRAGRIIDQLEAAGIVGPFAGSKTREVKVANEFALEQILRDLNID